MIKNILILFISILSFCFVLSCADLKVEDAKVTPSSENVLTSIGNRVITVNDYIKRCEYVPRPNYCKNNNYIKIIFWGMNHI